MFAMMQEKPRTFTTCVCPLEMRPFRSVKAVCAQNPHPPAPSNPEQQESTWALYMDAGAEQMAPLYPWVDQLDVGQVEQGRVLGEGSFGVVRAAKTSKHTECALKLVRPEAPPHVRWATAQEANVMARLNGHRFVLKLLTAVVEPDDPPRVIGYITELARFGSLTSFLKRHRQSLPDMVLMSLRIAEGVGYVHVNGHLHLDLKLDNVLVAYDDLLGAGSQGGRFWAGGVGLCRGGCGECGGRPGHPGVAGDDRDERSDHHLGDRRLLPGVRLRGDGSACRARRTSAPPPCPGSVSGAGG
jgi:hypothetical protein